MTDQHSLTSETLAFEIDDDAILRWRAGGCRPASEPETAMWRRIAELEAHNATLERSNKRLREKCDRLADTAMARGDR